MKSCGADVSAYGCDTTIFHNYIRAQIGMVQYDSIRAACKTVILVQGNE